MLLNGKNAGKLWDPANLVLKCESAIIIASEQQKSNKMHRLVGSQVCSYQTVEGFFCQRVVFSFLFLKIQETTGPVYGNALILKWIISVLCTGSLSEFTFQ